MSSNQSASENSKVAVEKYLATYIANEERAMKS